MYKLNISYKQFYIILNEIWLYMKVTQMHLVHAVNLEANSGTTAYWVDVQILLFFFSYNDIWVHAGCMAEHNMFNQSWQYFKCDMIDVIHANKITFIVIFTAIICSLATTGTLSLHGIYMTCIFDNMHVRMLAASVICEILQYYDTSFHSDIRL